MQDNNALEPLRKADLSMFKAQHTVGAKQKLKWKTKTQKGPRSRNKK